MPLTQIRFREDDLCHVNGAVARCAEQILASTRLPAGCACRYDWGIFIEQPESARRWPQRPGSVEYRHLLDEIELVSELGVFALANRAIDHIPAGKYIGVCAWFNRLAAAQYLWERLHFCGYDRHVIETYLTFKLTERPSNDQRPGFSKIRHGTLLRFGAALSQAAKQYFILDGITAQAQPTTIPLGGDTYLVFACSDNNPHESIHAIIVGYEWSAHMAAKELQRWMKQKKPKENSLK